MIENLLEQPLLVGGSRHPFLYHPSTHPVTKIPDFNSIDNHGDGILPAIIMILMGKITMTKMVSRPVSCPMLACPLIPT